MGGRNGDTQNRGDYQGRGARNLGAEAGERSDLGKAAAEGLDDLPASDYGTQRNQQIRHDHQPVGHELPGFHVVEHLQQGVVGLGSKRRREQHSHDSHSLLAVIEAEAEGEQGRREELQTAEHAVRHLRAGILQEEKRNTVQDEPQHHSDERREHYEK